MKISAVICTYNRDKYILEALESLKNQTLDKKQYEIVIVNNNSTDRTEELSHGFIKDNPFLTVRYFVEKQQGLSFARNRGITEAKTPIVTFIDDDGLAREDFLENIVKYLDAHPKADAVGGKIIPIYSSGKEPVWMSKYIIGIVSGIDLGEKVMEFPKNRYPFGCNMTMRKKCLEEVGMFNTDLKLRSDDKDIFNKLKKAGKRVFYLPNLVVRHYIDDYRLTPQFVDKVSNYTGASERLRLKGDGIISFSSKIGEYLFKLFASYALGVTFLLKGQASKAVYLHKVRWGVLKGFINGNL